MISDTQIEKAEYIKIRKLSFEKENPGTEVSDELERDVEREVGMSEKTAAACGRHIYLKT